jgi:hypothetical protein
MPVSASNFRDIVRQLMCQLRMCSIFALEALLMKRFVYLSILVLALLASASPGHAFVDYFFGGSSNSGAIDNSALGDMRAWWTGNPAYQFNPFYSGSGLPGQQNPQAAAANPMGQYSPQAGSPQNREPSVSFVPSSGGQPVMQGYGQPVQIQQAPAMMPQQGYAPQPQGYQYQHPQPQTGYPMPPQGYAPPQGYQPQPQAYQPDPQTAYQGQNGMWGGAGYVPGQQ